MLSGERGKLRSAPLMPLTLTQVFQNRVKFGLHLINLIVVPVLHNGASAGGHVKPKGPEPQHIYLKIAK
jgi:hypothetical protein